MSNTVSWPSRAIASAGSLLLLAGLCACSAPEASSDRPYASQFEQARSESTTDFQRDVLDDDVITEEEFREVRQRYVDCLADAGIRAEALADGSYDMPDGLQGKNADADMACATKTVIPVESLYYTIRSNPQNEDFSALIVECLQAKGVVDDAFAKEDWDEFVSAFAALAGDGSTPAPAASELPTLPGGVQMDDPDVQSCSSDPLRL